MTGAPTCPVTVVMVTHNRRAQTLTTVERLTSLSEQPPVIVVDNASDDGTSVAVIEAFPNVTVLRLDDNIGAVGRTIGVRAAHTPYVAFSDDDSWWAAGSLSRAAGMFDADPELGLVAARILIGSDERLDPMCVEMAASPLEPHRGRPSVLGFVACGAIVRREAYLAVGGFHPAVFFVGEETILAQDLAVVGYHLVYTDDIVAHHHPLPGDERAGRRRLQARNALLSQWLRRPAPVAMRATLRQMWSRDPDARGAILDAVRRLAPALAGRRVLPKRVERKVRLLESHGRRTSGR